MKLKERKMVVLNQAANYLTIGVCNEFVNAGFEVVLITGSVHVQGEPLSHKIKIDPIIKWQEEHGIKKGFVYIQAMWSMWWKLMMKYSRHEVFFISVPPMAYLLNLILPHRFSMLIWDVYPDVLKITGMKEEHRVYRIWSQLNRFSFKKAYKLFTIGEVMKGLLSNYTNRQILVQPIWSIFQENNKIAKEKNPFVQEHKLENKLVVQYSGNIGFTHKVELMLELAERLKENQDILFQIIGRGPRKLELEKLVKEKKLENCQFLPFQSDEIFPFSISAADLGIVILDEQASTGSVPSKSYNLMSYGIPSLYLASADSELNFYARHYEHAACFTEKQLDQAAEFILKAMTNRQAYEKMVCNSLLASQHFKRDNAQKLVMKYLDAS
ncbi:glycosyltransferase family 4 protein [Namhaeicola litoreus]|uniref:Glycosyltransferase family 4 protein n=1 Tax=Namhaeicola litoreus TaxID=1052145 RepID=A0ABW3Y4U1_9FLAO